MRKQLGGRTTPCGKGGQNIRLASELTQWKLNVLSETEALEKDDEEIQKITDLFVESALNYIDKYNKSEKQKKTSTWSRID